MKHPFVQVVWWDAADYPGAWVEIEDAIAFGDRPTEVVDYGYLVHMGKHYVVLAAGFIQQDEPGKEGLTLSRVTKIPRPWIKSVKKIKARRANAAIRKR